MRFILTGIRTTLAHRLRSLRGWLPVLLIPLLALSILRALPSREMAAPVQVGVSLPEQGAEEFRELLEARSGTVLTFVFCDVQTIDRNVAAGIWDCGLVLPEDFETRLAALELRRLITIRTGAGSVVYPLVRETVSACLAQLVSPEIAWEYLVEKGMVAPEGDTGAIRDQLAQVLSEEDRVIVTMVTADGMPLEPLQLADTGINTAIYWLISAMMMVWLLLSATQTSQWLRSAGAGRMSPMQPATCRILTQTGADGLLAVFSGCLAMLLLGAAPAGWWAAASYGAFWMAAAVLLSRWPGISGGLPVILPFGVVISLLTSGALADPALVLPMLEPVFSRLPVQLFLLGCGGSMGACVQLLCASAVFLSVSMMLDRIKKTG